MARPVRGQVEVEVPDDNLPNHLRRHGRLLCHMSHVFYWLKHTLKKRSPTTLIGVVGVVVVLVFERAFVVGGEVMAATTRILVLVQ